MNPLMLLRAGLLGVGKIPGFLGRSGPLFRGTGWRKGAKGTATVRPPTMAPYTPVARTKYKGKRPKYEPITPPTGTPPYSPLYTDPATVVRQQAGYLRRKPVRSAVYGGLGAGAVGLGAYPFIGGDEEPPIGPTRAMATGEPWAAPSDMLTFAEQEAARVVKGEAMMSDMLTKGFLISAAGGNPNKFFDMGLEVMKQTQAFQQDKQFADVVTAVYKKGDMPKNAREAYERLAPLVGPEKAATLSGHQLGMEPGKTKEERAWRKIEDMAIMGDIEGAAAALVAAWRSGLLKNPATHITNYDAQMDRARETLQGVMSGGAGYAEGVQNIRAASA
jgi:hypothetical protein